MSVSRFCLSKFCLVEILSYRDIVCVEILSVSRFCLFRDFVRVEILTVEVMSVEVNTELQEPYTSITLASKIVLTLLNKDISSSFRGVKIIF